MGQILENNGVDVAFTRTEDVYNTPFEKAQIANRESGDFLISFHRNSSPQANQYSGVETLVFNRSGQKVELAENINRELENVGFRNLGVKERPGLVILRRSRMPAVLVEAGFLNTDEDNVLFDEQFDQIAQGIANGILQTLGQIPTEAERMEAAAWTGEGTEPDSPTWDMEMGARGVETWRMETDGMEEMGTQIKNMQQGIPQEAQWEERCRPCQPRMLYRVQTGAFRNRKYAEDQLYQLLGQNFPAYILWEDRFFKVQVGAYRQLDNAVRMEQALRSKGYATYITT